MPIFEFDVVKLGEGVKRLALDAADMSMAQAKAMEMGYGVLGLTGVRDEPGAVVKPKPPPDLAPAPRTLPPLVYLGNLFGGFANQFAWFWLGISMVFAWVVVAAVDPRGMYDFSGHVRSAQGTVVESKESSAKMNGRSVYETHYTFAADDGGRLDGVSYNMGPKLERGSTVTVEYPEGLPGRSRIHGMSRGMMAAADLGSMTYLFLFISPFLIIGFAMLFVGVRSGLRANRLLAHGKAAYGRLKSRESTIVSVNHQPVEKLTFSFTTEDGAPAEAVVKTYQMRSLTDASEEKLLYDPQNPSRAVFLDILPSGAAIDNHGELVAAWPMRAARNLVAPALVLTAHGIVAYFLLWL